MNREPDRTGDTISPESAARARASAGQRSGPRKPGLQLVGAWVLVVLIDLAAVFGIFQLAYDDGLVRTFQSDNPHFERYVDFQETFTNAGGNLFLLLEGDGLASPTAVPALEDFLIDLSLSDSVSAVISAFSLPAATPDAPAPLSELSEQADAQAVRAYLATELDRAPDLQRFLSLDPLSMIMVVQPSGSGGLFATVDGLADDWLAEHDITVTRTGYAVVRASIIDRLFGDFLMLNLIGIALGTVVSALALRSFVSAMLVSLSAITALLWVLGAMGLLGVPINVITVALPALILVLAFSDALHLSFETRHQAQDGSNQPILLSLKRVGPACLLASVTTAIAFGALTLSSSALVTQLGQTGALAALIAVLAVLVIHPLLHATLDKVVPLARFYQGTRGNTPRLLTELRPLRWVGSRPLLESGMACLILATAILFYLNVPLSFSMYENVSDDQPAYRAAREINQNFGPTGALHLQLMLDPARDGADLTEAHTALTRVLSDHDVLSLQSLEDRNIPITDEIRANWIRTAEGEETERALITVPFDYRESAATRTLVNDIEARIAADAEASTLALSPVTGLETMTSFVSRDMLRDLNRSFLIAIAVSGLTMAIWLRDPLAGFVALLPNVLPIALIGGYLSITGKGLDFASAIALIVAFGLAIDDTVHVLNRLRLNLGGTIWAGREKVLEAVRQVAPILVITSIVLSFGLLGTQWASLPSVMLFGQLCITVFVLALIADLIVLPAFLLAVRRIVKGEKP